LSPPPGEAAGGTLSGGAASPAEGKAHTTTSPASTPPKTPKRPRDDTSLRDFFMRREREGVGPHDKPGPGGIRARAPKAARGTLGRFAQSSAVGHSRVPTRCLAPARTPPSKAGARQFLFSTGGQ